MDWINGSTIPIAVIGNPISHSLSPLMHNIFLKSLGLNYVYIPLEVKKEALKEAIKGLWALGFKGANVTIPHKEGVIPFLSGLSSQAELIGAVNTLVRKDNGFWGDNTDGEGLLAGLLSEKDWHPQGKKIVILGAGGSAKAVSISLALAGARELFIVNRTLSKAKVIAEKIEGHIGIPVRTFTWDNPVLDKIINCGDAIINTTPLGMIPNVRDLPPINLNSLSSGQLVVDLIYNPLKTRLIQEAKKRGCQVSNGLGMLVNQGALSFKMWTGKEPPVAGIKKELEEYLSTGLISKSV